MLLNHQRICYHFWCHCLKLHSPCAHANCDNDTIVILSGTSLGFRGRHEIKWFPIEVSGWRKSLIFNGRIRLSPTPFVLLRNLCIARWLITSSSETFRMKKPFSLSMEENSINFTPNLVPFISTLEVLIRLGNLHFIGFGQTLCKYESNDKIHESDDLRVSATNW